jgi:glycosyltransferase involved in cell wall biosynthesis
VARQIPLKSFHITNYYHKNSGGISTAYNKLLEAANRRGRFVRLIVPGENSGVEEVGEFGRIYYIKAGFSPVFDQRYRVMLPWKTYIFDKAPIKTILRREKPEIIEIGEKYSLSLMAGLMRKGILNVSEPRPMLVHFSCERMDDNVRSFVTASGAGEWFARRLMGNYNFPMFDFHLANSDYTARELLDAAAPEENRRRSKRFFNFCWRFFRSAKTPAAARVFVNQCGADNETFSAARKNPVKRREILREYDLPDEARVLLYAGRLSPEKNVALLPEMMKILAAEEGEENDFRLLIAGSGPNEKWLRTEAEKIGGGKIKILGHVAEREKLADLFANADAFVHPNPREPFGIAPLEAMASGLPVAAPNSGGILSYASDRNAWLVRQPTARDFAAAIREIFADDAKRKDKIAAALKTAARYDWEASTDRLFALYDQMYAEFTRNRELYDYRKNVGRIDFAENFAVEER